MSEQVEEDGQRLSDLPDGDAAQLRGLCECEARLQGGECWIVHDVAACARAVLCNVYFNVVVVVAAGRGSRRSYPLTVRPSTAGAGV